MPRGPFAFHEVVRLGALWKWSLFVVFGGGVLLFVKHAPPLPMGEGPGVRAGLVSFLYLVCFL